MAVSTKGTILVTGANGGLGSALAHHVATHSELSSYHGIYTVRGTVNAQALGSALESGPTHLHDVVALELTKLDTVRLVAEQINRRVAAGEIPPIHTLVLNAGYQDFGKQTATDDGLDTVFVSNYLGHWLLTLLLLQSIDKQAGRIVILGSQAHDPADPRNVATGAFVDPQYHTIISDAAGFEAIAKGEWSRSVPNAASMDSFRTGFRRYGAAKLFLVMMQHELQARLNKDPNLNSICVVGIDPGTMPSGLQREAPWVIRVLMFKIFYPFMLWLSPKSDTVKSPSRGATDVIEVTLGASGELLKDKYFNGRTPYETSDESKDAAKREMVWNETTKLAGLSEGDTVLVDWK